MLKEKIYIHLQKTPDSILGFYTKRTNLFHKGQNKDFFLHKWRESIMSRLTLQKC